VVETGTGTEAGILEEIVEAATVDTADTDSGFQIIPLLKSSVCCLEFMTQRVQFSR